MSRTVLRSEPSTRTVTTRPELVVVPPVPVPEAPVLGVHRGPSVLLPRVLLFWLCVVLAAAWCVGLSLVVA